jgi:hypothetical protein
MGDVTILLQVNIGKCIDPLAASASKGNGWQEICINWGKQCDTNQCRPIPPMTITLRIRQEHP